MAQKKKDSLDLWLEANTELFGPVIPFTYRRQEDTCDNLCRVCKKQDCPCRALPLRPDLK